MFLACCVFGILSTDLQVFFALVVWDNISILVVVWRLYEFF